jgi:hypothetical protein
MTNAKVMIGEKMWLASVDAKSSGTVREIKPLVRRVRLCDRDDRAATMRVIAIASGKEMTVSQADLHVNRKHAIKRGEQLCSDLDGQSPFGAFRYKYVRPDDATPPAVEVRMRQVSPDRFTVEVKFPGCRSFKACRGLRRLPLWEAEKVAADLRADRDVRGRYEFDMTGERKRVEFFKIDRRKASSRPIRSAN